MTSGSGQPLSFTGVVNPADPNTIFLDAAGDRNVVALIGHEWAHTLALTNPELHRGMTDAMRPSVVGWMEQEGILREEGYGEGQVTEELTSNIVGDAIADPEFWRQLAARNPSLFERVVRAIKEWFASVGAQKSGEATGRSADLARRNHSSAEGGRFRRETALRHSAQLGCLKDKFGDNQLA